MLREALEDAGREDSAQEVDEVVVDAGASVRTAVRVLDLADVAVLEDLVNRNVKCSTWKK